MRKQSQEYVWADGLETVQELQEYPAVEKSNPTSTQCRILSEPQRAQVWGDQQGQSGEGVRG